MKADGLFEPYLLMGDRLRAELTTHTAGQEPIEIGSFVQVTLEYDPLTFLVIGIKRGLTDFVDIGWLFCGYTGKKLAPVFLSHIFLRTAL